MNEGPPDDRFALALLGNEGVLVDLQRGAVLLLNATAASIWRMHQDGLEVEAIAAALAARHGIAADDARRDVALALDPSAVPVPPPTPDPFHYEREGDQYVVTYAGQRLFENSVDGETLRLIAGRSVSEPHLRGVLIPLAPKLLSLQGVRVLHASAVKLPRGVVAVSGPSGAGKTTTARALAAGGAPLVAEDKLVLAPGPMLAVVNGERCIHAWAKDAAHALAGGAAQWDCRALRECQDGATAPLISVAMLDAAHRQAKIRQFVHTPMTPAEAAAALLLQTFVGTAAPEIWRRNLADACAVATSVPIARLAAPDGLEALAEAARAYASNSTS